MRSSSRGRTLLPGLFDCHVHVGITHVDLWRLAHQPVSYRVLDAARNLAATLDAGITSVRDAGGADLGIRQARDEGLVRGPRIQVSLAMISQTGGHGDDWLPSGIELNVSRRDAGHPGHARRRPRRDAPGRADADPPGRRRDQGRDLRRSALAARQPTHGHLRPAELAVLVEEATAAGIFVMAHAQATDGIKNAVRAGIRSIEHGIYLDDEAIELMLQRGTWFVPTLVAPQGVIDAAEAGRRPGPRDPREGARGDRHPPRGVPAGRRRRRADRDGHRLRRHAARPQPAGARADGRGRDDARGGARGGHSKLGRAARRRDRLGTIEPGKIADITVVAGDPFDFATIPERIESVWQDGRRVGGSAAA